MSEIRKTTHVQVVQSRQTPEYLVVKTEDLAVWAQQQRQPWRNPPDPVNEQANASTKRLVMSCLGITAVLAGCSLFISAVTPDPPAPAPVIIQRPIATPTPAPAGNNQQCRENCFSF